MTDQSREFQSLGPEWEHSPIENSPSIAEETSLDGKCSSLRSRTAGSDLDGCQQVPCGNALHYKTGISCWTRKTDIASALVEFQKKFLLKERETAMMKYEKRSALHCPECKCFYIVPITLSCGHTLCKTCIHWSANGDQNYSKIDCRHCGARNVTNRLSVNVLMSHLIQKWFPQQYESEVMKLENVQRERMRGERANVVATLSDVLETSPFNFTALKWRSHALFEMEKCQQALEDADKACVLRPFLPSVFHHRGLILVAMDSYEKAALSFARCVALDSSNARYLSLLLSCLSKLLNSESAQRKKFLEQFAGLNSAELTSNRSKLPASGRLFDDTTAFNKNEAESGKLRKRSKSSETGISPSTADYVSAEKRSARKRTFQETALEAENCEDVALLFRTEPSRSKFRKLSRQKIQVMTKEDLECKICYSVLLQPTTTACGHTFCRTCLQRSLDFRPDCPYCRQSLDCRVASNTEVTWELKEMVETLFPDECAEREQSFTDEKANWKGVGVDDNIEVPVFVCVLAFPSLNYPLHIFEPRYRLMIRKCYELGTRMFGMCTKDADTGFSEYGTMLHVDKMELLSDGRSVIQTTATRRFRVKSRSMRDGYNVAKVQWLEDEVPELNAEVKDLNTLSVDCRNYLRLWFNSLTEIQQTCVTNAIGPIPTAEDKLESNQNGPSWLWWALAAIPLQDRAKLIILSMTSLNERLRSVRRFLQLLISNR